LDLFWTYGKIAGLLLSALLTLPCPAQQSQRTFRVPFHTVNGTVLLDATVSNRPAVFLLDTDADFTLISPEAAGVSRKLDALSATSAANTTGAAGEYVKGRVDLRLVERFPSKNPRIAQVINYFVEAATDPGVATISRLRHFHDERRRARLTGPQWPHCEHSARMRAAQ